VTFPLRRGGKVLTGPVFSEFPSLVSPLSHLLMEAGKRMRRIVGATLLSGLAAVALGAGATAGTQLTAEQIVEKNVAARGGLEAWHKVDTMVWFGHLESSRAQLPSMPFTMQQKRPNKSRFEINTPGEKTLRVFDGTRGWKVKPARNGRGGTPEPYTPQEVTFAFRSQGIDGPLIDYQAKRNKVALEGTDEVEGHKAFRLKVELASGETDHVWIDSTTFLEVRYDRPTYGPAGTPQTVSMFYRDYKPVENLQIPMVIETAGGPGAPPDKIVIDRVFLNTPVDDRAFAQPGMHERRGTAMGGGHRMSGGPGIVDIPPPGASPAAQGAPPQQAAPAASAGTK
jgi:outer membrane lipoprotein-sorting protein